MDPAVAGKMDELADRCRRRHVRRLALFGSAASGRSDPTTSDLDFVVEFESLTPAEHADSYFGLCEDLEKLFGRPVDLVELGPIRNPYFLESVAETQVVLYDAA